MACFEKIRLLSVLLVIKYNVVSAQPDDRKFCRSDGDCRGRNSSCCPRSGTCVNKLSLETWRYCQGLTCRNDSDCSSAGLWCCSHGVDKTCSSDCYQCVSDSDCSSGEDCSDAGYCVRDSDSSLRTMLLLVLLPAILFPACVCCCVKAKGMKKATRTSAENSGLEVDGQQQQVNVPGRQLQEVERPSQMILGDTECELSYSGCHLPPYSELAPPPSYSNQVLSFNNPPPPYSARYCLQTGDHESDDRNPPSYEQQDFSLAASGQQSEGNPFFIYRDASPQTIANAE